MGARLPSADRLLVHVVGLPPPPRSRRRLLPSLEELRQVKGEMSDEVGLIQLL